MFKKYYFVFISFFILVLFVKPIYAENSAVLLNLLQEQKYTQILIANDNSPQNMFYKACSYYKLNRYTEAGQYFQKFLLNIPNLFPFIEYYKIILNYNITAPDTSIDSLKKINSLINNKNTKYAFFSKPSYLDLLINSWVGDLYYAQNKFSLSEKYFNEVISLYQSTDLVPFETFQKLEKIYSLDKSFFKRLKNWLQLLNGNYKLASNKNSHSPLNLYRKALLLEQENDYQQALLIWNQFLLKKPTNFYLEFALYKQAYCLFHMNQYTQAKNRLLNIIKTFPHTVLNKEIFYLLGNIEELQGNKTKAIYFYDLIINRFPNTTYYLKSIYRLAVMNYQLNNSCIPLLFNMAQSKNKNQRELIDLSRFYLGLILYKEKNFREANYFFYQCYANSKDTEQKIKSLYWLAKAKSQLKYHREARLLFTKVIKLDKDGGIYTYFAKLYLNKLPFGFNIKALTIDQIKLPTPLNELNNLGFIDFVKNELIVKSKLESDLSKRKEFQKYLGYYYYQNNDYQNAIKTISEGFSLNLTQDKWLLKIAYPIPYINKIKNIYVNQRISPLLISALLRSENNFSENWWSTNEIKNIDYFTNLYNKYRNLYYFLTLYFTNSEYQISKKQLSYIYDDPTLYLELLIDDVKQNMDDFFNTYLKYKLIYQ